MSFIAGTRITSGTGGITTSITGYKVHIFDTPGAATFIPRGSGVIEVLVVGGGGAGGSGVNSSGGGGGAVFYNKFVNVTSGTPYPITVGASGSPTGGISSCTFNNVTMIAYGGGAGGSTGQAGFASPNASGGGGSIHGSGFPGGVGAGITGLGFPGAPLGGGGGATSPGLNYYQGGNGGIGVSYSITGTSSYYGAGARGYNGSPNGGLPGASYGTGGGGSDGGGPPAFSGAVIIRYPS